MMQKILKMCSKTLSSLTDQYFNVIFRNYFLFEINTRNEILSKNGCGVLQSILLQDNYLSLSRPTPGKGRSNRMVVYKNMYYNSLLKRESTWV